MKQVLVTGVNGQLGQYLKELSEVNSDIKFTFLGSHELDITNQTNVKRLFENNDFDYCINCAAYTAVDAAEGNLEKAYKVNVDGVVNLVNACKQSETVLIHISTDFVFDGNTPEPYTETDATYPLSVYGQTKLEGEERIKAILDNYFIFRTSWLYSEYGNNFMKTMLRLGQERTELSVVGDQIGTPTYAKDLAQVILKVVTEDNEEYGIYHYSNEGEVSWYDFAKEIFSLANCNVRLNKITTSEYPTSAKRPQYSVLSKDKIVSKINVKIPNWKDSLKQALEHIKK
ncbi:MAG: dTDP-4-dehydrorhamnose reductase [Flavobacteriaceae bacterium]